MSANPVLVSFLRGGKVESCHRGAVVVAGPAGTVKTLGDPAQRVFWRSAAKPFQAAAALAAGVAETFDLAPAEIALLAASHSGEPFHVERVAGMLARGRLAPADLRCGVHPPLGRRVVEELARSGTAPTVLHNNCSGKHTGMLLACRQLDAPLASYLEPEHPVQRAIARTIERVAEIPAGALETAIDGCSAPTFHAGLDRLATAFRNLGTPESAPEADRPGLRRVRDAMLAHPEMVAGTDRFDTDLMRAGGGRIVSKIGAEGIVGCAIVERGLGIAVKIDDGNERGYVPVLLALLDQYGALDGGVAARLGRWADPVLRNHARIETGRIEVHL
jgi:L-asparaginase II